MPIPVNVGIIIGIAAGGLVIICALSILLMRLILRFKHKRRMAQMVTGAGGRLSRSPSSHMRISDEDVARMPGTNATARSSLQGYYNRSPYTPMSSRETPELRMVLKNLEKAKGDARVNREAVVPPQSWPLPRRLTRSDGTPLANIPTSSTSPKKKTVDKGGSCPKHAGIEAGQAAENAPPDSLEIAQKRLDNTMSPSVGLKPKPLFHGRQRSTSNGTISQMTQATNVAGSPTPYAKETGTRSLPKSHHSRSTSVCSQDPGAAPTHVLPPLPFEIPSKGKRSVKAPANFSTCESLFSESTSILNDEESRILSEAETDLMSIGLASPHETTPVSESRFKRLVPWDTAGLQERASPVSATKVLKPRPQLNTQKSFRASVQYSLPSCGNSGLSMSLLDHVSRKGSAASSPKEASRVMEGPRNTALADLDRNKLDQRNLEACLIRHSIRFKSPEELRSKRASTSALRPISGNEGWPMLNSWDRRPSSIAIEDPFQWNPHTSMPPGKPSDEASGHKRQTCIRISSIPLIAPSPPKTARIDEREQSSQKLADTVIRKPEPSEVAVRPPPKPTLNFRCTPRRGRISTAAQTPPFSPTGTMFNFYQGANSSPDSAISTPTKRPSRRISSGDRLSSIPDKSFTASWRLSSSANDELAKPTKEKRISTTTTQHQHDSQDLPTTDPDSHPPSFLFDFPNPPKRTNHPTWRMPKTPIRGPRLPPPEFHTSPLFNRHLSRSRSKSPPQSPSSRISKTHSNSPSSFDLRRSIMALRRQNSEVNIHVSKGSLEHKRYLSIGDCSDKESVYSVDSGKENEGMGMGQGGGGEGGE